MKMIIAEQKVYKKMNVVMSNFIILMVLYNSFAQKKLLLQFSWRFELRAAHGIIDNRDKSGIERIGLKILRDGASP
jgi:hypothetical protein